ncbi:MAG: hypothetical protein AAGA30_03300 [Planctomycetota bacterium]
MHCLAKFEFQAGSPQIVLALTEFDGIIDYMNRIDSWGDQMNEEHHSMTSCQFALHSYAGLLAGMIWLAALALVAGFAQNFLEISLIWLVSISSIAFCYASKSLSSCS